MEEEVADRLQAAAAEEEVVVASGAAMMGGGGGGALLLVEVEARGHQLVVEAVAARSREPLACRVWEEAEEEPHHQHQ